MESSTDIETHPWPAFTPGGAKVLVMGTFPPGSHRWNMDFYYPNRTNDFWYIMGLIFFGDRNALLAPDGRNFDLEAILKLCTECGIALNDTVYRARRLQGNASDKFLEVIEPVDLASLLAKLPGLRAIATTGEKAADTLAALTGTEAPKMGCHVPWRDGIDIWRMPSTSRAYPLALAKKAEYYERLFRAVGML